MEGAMSESTMQAVMERLDRLERDLRWWKRLGVACSIGLALLVALGATRARLPDEIRAKRFVVSDDDGKSYAALQLYKPYSQGAEPSAMLTFYENPSGRQLMNLGLGLAGHNTELHMLANDIGATATLTADGLDLVKGNRAALRADGLTLNEDAAKPLEATTARYSFSSLIFGDKGKGSLPRSRASFGLLFGNAPGLVLYDSNDSPRAVLGSYGIETIKTGEETRLPESSLVLFDKDGKVIWQAP